MRRLLFVLLLTVAAACGPPAAGGSDSGLSDAAGAGQYDGEWRLVSGSGPSGDIPVPGQVTLTLAGRKASGVSACNHYQADVEINGSTIAVTGMGGTEMGCPGKRTVAEERYSAALQAAEAIGLDGERLRISGPDVDLLFAAIEPPKPAPFEDTKWKLTTLMIGRGPSGTAMSTGAPASLTFRGDGSLTATTGCVDITAQWQRDGDTVTVTDLPRIDVDCPNVSARQHDHLMEIWRAPFTVELRPRQLDLQQVNGNLGAGYSAD